MIQILIVWIIGMKKNFVGFQEMIFKFFEKNEIKIRILIPQVISLPQFFNSNPDLF